MDRFTINTKNKSIAGRIGDLVVNRLYIYTLDTNLKDLVLKCIIYIQQLPALCFP